MSASRYLSDNSNPESPGDPLNGSFNSTMDRFLAAAIISGVVGTAATIAIVYFIIDCLKKAGTAIPSLAKIATNDLEKFPQVVRPLPSEVISVTPPAISPGHNWDVPNEFGTLERFLNPPRFSSDQLAAYTSGYATVLGSGAYGVVFKGELPNGTLVAVKVLTNAHDKRMKEQFMAEVSSIGRTHHINLVRLYGFCFDPTTRALVYEYMENGSLDKFLLGDQMAIDGHKMHEIAVGTAKGIAYLHEECEQQIVHYDIKPGNILLDQNLRPKIADFGLAKLCNRESSQIPMTGFRGTHGYAAPEMSKPYPVTYRCDVYSFGMVLFDIMERRINHDMDLKESMSGLPQCTWHILQNDRLLEMVCGFPESERKKAMMMLKVALWCIQYKPEARPMMSAVVKMLEADVEIPTPDCPFENPNLDKPSQGSGNGSERYSDSSAFIIS
ncbi:LEAF RUST 10 DISEASE-RESISTANCE LOCUS RECEPTOR-LIKE PROTEIN KINASE-like 2.2 [Eucalyptus grandis]|uniref:LEAF RUST 10 DISEASE-RESISTANCE LOCUS RECEPTOR-LIKE PROTEIN KINASE-like 2.2 n=1 Tax=Eucalyptus grandis TaxID=71139 RepID=UPI00192F07B8|nr:LEAF RUST 10 DISEASE-RESISTANCE LOCUS RECEPTOR-LIKE PROTEIN KINASE-like 2.2 [Eucalyptus grandis]